MADHEKATVLARALPDEVETPIGNLKACYLDLQRKIALLENPAVNENEWKILASGQTTVIDSLQERIAELERQLEAAKQANVESAGAATVLQAQLESERKVREEAERKLSAYAPHDYYSQQREEAIRKIADQHMLIAATDHDRLREQKRAETLESKLAATKIELDDRSQICQSYIDSLAALGEQFSSVEVLCKGCEEVISEHADPESPFYNHCDNGEDCQWCVNMKEAISTLKKLTAGQQPITNEYRYPTGETVLAQHEPDGDWVASRPVFPFKERK